MRALSYMIAVVFVLAGPSLAGIPGRRACAWHDGRDQPVSHCSDEGPTGPVPRIGRPAGPPFSGDLD
jgi:hypothetical protein